jgi:DNA polymerase (family 10)
LQYFTGSKAHNIALRQIAAARGSNSMNMDYSDGTRRVAGRAEEEIYRYLGLPCIEPEPREDYGEVEAARSGKLPHPVTLADIAATCKRRSRYLNGDGTGGPTTRLRPPSDHSKRVAIAHGLDAKRLAEQSTRSPV